MIKKSNRVKDYTKISLLMLVVLAVMSTGASADITNLNFTNKQVSAFNISGFKINDTNGNGVWDAGETGLPDWNITLMNVETGTVANASTNNNGFFNFTDIDQGNYTVFEEIREGWRPTNASSKFVILNSNIANLNFTNKQVLGSPFNISGYKINDSNGNGVSDNNEKGIQGWNIMLFNFTTGAMDNTTTDANGFYKFTDIPNGTYMVIEQQKLGWNSTNGTSIYPGFITYGIFNVTINGQDIANLNFTNQFIGGKFNISGYKINDTNGNGLWDTGEQGIDEWKIMLKNATTGMEIANTLTNATGFYNFTNLATDDYTVTEEKKTGWIPTSTTSKNVTLDSDITSLIFTNTQVLGGPANITGFKINDTSGNGEWNTGEQGIPGWNITLINDTGAISTNTTDSNGFYKFTNLAPGSYLVKEETKKGWMPTNDTFKMIILNNQTVPSGVEGPTFNISGHKINDTNGNGTWDAGEQGIKDWNITLKNATTGAMLSSISTNEAGLYKFANVPNGSYIVTEEMKTGWKNTSATFKEVNVAGQDVMNQNFTNNLSAIPTGAPNITSFAPPSPVNDTITPATRTFNISVNQTVNVTWYLDGTVKEQDNLTTAANSTMAVNEGMHNVTAVAQNTNGSDMQKWDWNVTAAPPVQTYNISGYKINDTNGNGTGIAGWNITLWKNDTTIVTKIANTSTDAKGFYNFTNLINGSYIVFEETKPGWKSTNATFKQITIAGQDRTNQNFTNKLQPLATFNISGYKINDTNGNGISDNNEKGIANWNITLLNGATGAETKNSTDANGSYKFTNIAQGGYIVKEETKAGWTATNSTFRVIDLNQDLTNLNFTNQPVAGPTFNISGYKINDTNGNGISDNNEKGIANWNITLKNGTGTIISSTQTGANGFYKFTNLANGSYNVTEEIKAGWTPTNATFRQITIAGQDIMNVNFTNNVSAVPTGAPGIISFSPTSPVKDIVGAARTFNITVNQTVSVIWYINGTEVFNQTGVTASSYTNASAANGTWNVTAVAQNANGIAMQKWDWIVTPFNVSIVADALSKITEPSKFATYTLTITNTGTVNDSYELDASNTDGAVTNLSKLSVQNLTPGANATVLLNVTKATPGKFRVNVTATSKGDPRVFAYVNTTTTVLAANITGFRLDASGTRAGFINGSVNITNFLGNNQTFVIDVSGTNVATGYPLVTLATVTLNAGQSMNNIPVRIAIPPSASTGNYSLIAGIWKIEDFAAPEKLITTMGPQTVNIS